MPATSFGVGFTLLSDLEGVFVSVTATALTASTTVRGGIVGGGGRGRQGRRRGGHKEQRD